MISLNKYTLLLLLFIFKYFIKYTLYIFKHTLLCIHSSMATEAQRRARQAWKKRNPEKHCEHVKRCYFKKTYGMSQEEAHILGCVRYLFR